MDILAIQKQLEEHEGYSLKPYPDTSGKITIGVGRNLTDNGLSHGEVNFLLGNDISTVGTLLDHLLPWWRDLDEIRQRVIFDMAFNLGITKLLKFKMTMAAAKAHDYEKAAVQMLKSDWANQVGWRARRLSAMMQSGQEVPL